MKATQEKTSKLISYWLRHNPQLANLEVDEYGWVKLDCILYALQSNNITINLHDLIKLNQSFDKKRWEIDTEKNRIRAKHGHSFPININDKVDVPQEILYHGTAISSLSSIIKNGLLTMDRQFVHLSESFEMAEHVAKRHGKSFVIEIDTEELIKDGWKFYKTDENIWLTSSIPTKYLYFEPWFPTKDKDNYFINELKREIGNRVLHKLYFQLNNLELVWKSSTSDDTLFKNSKTDKHYMIHLTFTSKSQEIKGFPNFDTFNSFEEWLEEGLYNDQQNYYR